MPQMHEASAARIGLAQRAHWQGMSAKAVAYVSRASPTKWEARLAAMQARERLVHRPPMLRRPSTCLCVSLASRARSSSRFEDCCFEEWALANLVGTGMLFALPTFSLSSVTLCDTEKDRERERQRQRQRQRQRERGGERESHTLTLSLSLTLHDLRLHHHHHLSGPQCV